jgi:hypothetical protein
MPIPWTQLAPMLGFLALQAPATPSPSTPAGHWEGTIAVPGQALEIQVDLATRDQKWEGTVTIPAQNVKALPLSGIAVDGTAVRFGMPKVPGAPAFKGTLSSDRRTMSGDFTQGGGAYPFSLAWKGEPRLEVPTKNKPVGEELEGSWEGALDANGTKLRLVLKLANQDGASSGTLTSLDQGGIELPLSSIVQAASHLTVTVTSIGGTFAGDLKDGRLDGTWTQGGMSLPLVLARSSR